MGGSLGFCFEVMRYIPELTKNSKRLSGIAEPGVLQQGSRSLSNSGISNPAKLTPRL